MPSLQARALRLLAQREHSRRELESKLRDKASSPEALVAVLDALERKDWISAKRVAQSVLNHRSAQWGDARLRQALLAKGLPKEVVAASMNEIETSEWDRAQALWLRKYGQAAGNAKERARQMRFLLSRGFPHGLVVKVLHHTMAP